MNSESFLGEPQAEMGPLNSVTVPFGPEVTCLFLEDPTDQILPFQLGRGI